MSGESSVPAVSPTYARLLAAQAKASDPNLSAWVSANAGSGKTHVLTQRVIRLLLEDVDPARILCLTFTKAAAANMAARVFKTLSSWTALDDAALAAKLVEAGLAADKARTKIDFARKLFARAIETPGGLKIQTLHAFCEKLLHLFPFEANVAAGFRVIEEREAKELLDEARHAVFARAETSPDLAAAIERIAKLAGADGFDGLVRETLAKREDIAAYGGVEAYRERLRDRLGLAAEESVANIERAMLEGAGGPERWRRWAERLQTGLKTDKDRAALLLGAAALTDPTLQLSIYQDAFFTKAGEPRKSLITKGVAEKFPILADNLYKAQAQLETLAERRRLAETLERSVDLVRVAEAVLREYARLENARGLLDFDDLVERALTLLTKADSAWVLYKLDKGIDHFLVDEAQDTSRSQWEILQKLAEDFLSGHSQSRRRRTFFAVGDEKQSIFSFQGAAPDMFDAMRRDFERRHRAAELPFERVPLYTSFRSSPTILQAVDLVFSLPQAWRGVSAGEESAPRHEAFHAALPGLVELWEPIAPEPHPDPEGWRMPLDATSRADPAVRLAERIAGTIRGWLSPGSDARVIDKSAKAPRPVRAGDILILVRKRGAFYEAMTRALRRNRIPFAGADRLKLKDHIAVLDLASAGRAALTRDDDLALAEVLKSPLIDLSDDDLMEFAPSRESSLADALAASRFQAAALRLELWRERARTLAPYDFYARLIGVDGGRRALIGRLGPEAADAIDEFLALALAFERDGSPALSAFLDEVSASDVALKRDMEAEGSDVRVMTVHAAKGLEAAIVFLPDTADAPDGKRDPKWLQLEPVAPHAPALYAWATRKEHDGPPLKDARAVLRARDEGEHRRLLYVAMTRAAERLVVAAFEGASGRKQDCWYDLIRAGLQGAMREAPAPWDAQEAVWRYGEPAAAGTMEAAPEPAALIELPAWAETAAAREVEPASLAPSRLFGAGRVPDPRLDREAGRLAHALLQRLPDLAPERRTGAGADYLARHGGELSEARRTSILAQVSAIIADPELAPLFGPGSRAEVAISAQTPAPFHGRVDRLAVLVERVELVDFKSGGHPGPQARRAEVAQLALYSAALTALYRRPVVAWIVRLASGAKERVSERELEAALAELT